MSATPESKVKARIRAWLTQRGIYYAMPLGTGYGSSGVPDFLCCWKGRFLAIEAKAPGRRGSTTILQKFQLERIKSASGLALVVDDVAQLDQLEASLT